MTDQDRVLGGRYEVGELLGYGGMAEVHLGRDLRLGRAVAIKMLRTDLARDATFQARFRREAQNAASLNHPAIVAVYDTGEETGAEGEALPYIVMEYVSGRTLKEVLTEAGQLPVRQALEITADVCGALEFSHRHGIIHRDIKPGNVMFTEADQVKVMDFGIARAVAGTTTTMTQTSAVIGTAQYLSPEQARGETVDARSDVYATGCVLFELLTGAPPFTGDSPVSVAYQHVREEPKAPSERNPEIPAAVDAVVLKALAKSPASRYQSAAEMRADLLRAANGRPVQAPAATPSTQRTQVVGGAPVSGRGGDTGTQPAARVTDPARRRRALWVLISLGLLVVLALAATGIGLYLSNQHNQAFLPDVTGKLRARAVKIIKAKGFDVHTHGKVSSARDKGRVTAEAPQAGQSYDKSTKVELTIGTGPKTVRVPDLKNVSSKEAARNLLQQHHLKARFKSVDGVEAKGTVVATDPPAGTRVRINKTVTVSISRGNQATVPSVVGKSRADAESTLKHAGFTPVVKYVTTGDSDPGKVISQDPGGNATVGKGSDVTIQVAQQPSSTPSTTPSQSTPTPTNTPTSPTPTPTGTCFPPIGCPPEDGD